MQKLLMKAFLAAHVNVYRLSRGRVGASMRGAKVLLLTTIGRTSGNPWTVPLMDIEHDGHSHVIASAGGGPTDPAWFRNLTATPTVGVQRGAETFRARTEVLSGDERATVYKQAEEQYADFTTYAENAGREIPVVRLVPITD